MELNSSAETNKSQLDGSSGGLHVCPYCGKSFSRRSYLNCHITAHKSPALECDACRRQFGRVDSLRRHRCSAAHIAASNSNSATNSVHSKSKTLSVDSSQVTATTAVRQRHTCPQCEKSYSRRETLLQHIVRHHRELVDDSNGQQKAIEAYPCMVCHRVFASGLSLYNHEVLVHGGTAMADSVGFSCGGCGQQFASQLNVDRHLCPHAPQVQQNQPVLLAEQLQATFSDASASYAVESSSNQCDVEDKTEMLQQSVAETILVKRCVCQFCGRTFSSQGWLRRHVTAAHGDQFPVQSCEEVSSMVDQSAGSSSQAGRVCPVCGKSLSSVGNLNKHLLTHGPRRETCLECGRQFHQRATLQQHVRDIHAPPGSFAVECPTCGLRMRSRNSLYAHIARFHTLESSVPQHVCGMCGKSFHQRGNLRKHEQTHRLDAVYVCPDCPRRLRTAERLKRHQTWHQQGAEFACATCGRCFVQPSDLQRHFAFRHSPTNKTYRCCYCGVCCRHRQMMRRHLQRRHSDQVIWQTTDVRSFIESLAIPTVKPPPGGGHTNQGFPTVAASCSEDVQETEVPLTIGVDDNDAALDSSNCPPAFLFVDSSCLQSCTE